MAAKDPVRCARAKAWNKANPEKFKAAQERYRKKHGTTNLRRYGLTVDQYREMFETQGGLCAICGSPPGARALNVDHDHETGKVRGLLCTPCNTQLAGLERPGWVALAVAYLEGK